MKSLILITILTVALSVTAQVNDNTPAQSVVSNNVTNVMPCYLPENKFYQTEKDQLYRLIEGQIHHLRGLLKPWNNDSSMKLITESKSWENYIRPNTTFVADLAFVLHFGNFDEKIIGASKDKILETELIPMLRYLIRTHKTGDLKTSDGKSWGNAWQSAHWAAAFGNAAWWSWDRLPNDIREGARRVVTYEADRIERTIPPHQNVSDSKSEENAWNSQVLSAAILLMPNDTRRTKWEEALQKWCMSSYLRPLDEKNESIVDGQTVAKQYTGANIYNDFSLENHDFVHPDYMGAWIMNAGNELDYLLTKRKPFEASLFNLPQIYNLQKRFLLPDGGYCYPSGQDWAIFRNADWMPCHATALARFNDSDALYQLHNAIEAAQKMQARNSDGAIYAPGENYFASSQPHLGYWITQAWLVLHFAENEITETLPQAGVNNLTDGKIMIHRDDKVIQTVSWGLVKMIQMMPVAKDHIVSPDQRNGIGRISINGINNTDSILPIILKNIDVKPNENGFRIKMTVTHGDFIQAEITCETRADGSMTIEEELSALKPCTTNFIKTLSFGILNNPNWVYETGQRNLKIDKHSYEIKSASGFSTLAKAKSVSVDGLNFNLNASSIVSYETAKKIENSRFTDILVLNTFSEKKNWKQDEKISKKRVTIIMHTK
jgi:hypothetical protein